MPQRKYAAGGGALKSVELSIAFIKAKKIVFGAAKSPSFLYNKD